MDGLDNTQPEEELVGPPEPVVGPPEPQTSETQETEEELLDPSVVDFAAQELIKLPYDQATAKLKKLYTENKWIDKESAAQEVAKFAHILNTRDSISPKVELEGDVATLTQKLLNPNLDDEIKLEAIDDWHNEGLEKNYNTDDPEKLIGAIAREKTYDAYRTQFKRHVISKDRGLIMDGLARGMEAAISPIADTIDTAIDTGYGKKLREFAIEHENPNRDSDLASKAFSAAGSVGGFGLAALNPYTGPAYLGMVLTSQAKQVYDTALEETGSEEAAKNALLMSAPGITIGAFSHKLLGGTLAQTVMGKKGFLGTLTGAATGAGGMGAQTYLTGKALAEATANEAFEPQPGDVAESAVIGGAIGAVVGGYSDLSAKELGFKQAYEQFRKATGKQEGGAPAPKEPPPTDKGVDEYLNSFVKPEEDLRPTSYIDSEGEERLISSKEPADSSSAFMKATQASRAAEAEPVPYEFRDERVLTPEQQKLDAEVEALVDQYIAMDTKLQTTEGYFEGPMTEKQRADRIMHIEASIKDWSGDEKARNKMVQRLKDLKDEQKYYEEHPDKARNIQARKDATNAVRDEALNKAIKGGFSLSPRALQAFNMYGRKAEAARPTRAEPQAARQEARVSPLYENSVPYEELSNMQKLIPLSPPGYTPQPMAVHLINRILGELTDPANPHRLELADETKMHGNFAFVDPVSKRVVVRRQAFKDPEQARQTMAHEIGHILDNLARDEATKAKLALPHSEDESVAVKLIRLGQSLENLYNVPGIHAEARELSSQWRSGWDAVEEVPAVAPPPGDPGRERYINLVYRNSTPELHADVMSAILEKPQMVKSMFPRIWEAFEAGLDQQPKLKEFWNKIKDMNNNPEQISAFIREERQAGRKREAKATADKSERDLVLRDQIKKAKLKELPGLVRQYFGNKFAVARDVLEKVMNTADENIVEEQHGKLYSGPMNQSNQRVQVDEKVDGVIKEMDVLTKKLPVIVDPVTGERRQLNAVEESKNLDMLNQILKDKTVEMDNINKDEPGYKAAFDRIKETIDKSGAPNPIGAIDVTNLSGNPLLDAMAKMHLYVQGSDREQITKKIIEKNGKNLSETDLKAIELLQDGAFAARRYVANPSGIDPKTAELELKLMENRLGAENFRELTKLNEKFHDILFDYMYPRAEESGLFSDKLLRRMALNKRNYTTFNALKYFEKDPHISAKVRAAIGNIDQMGDEMAATIRKIKMIGAKADYQISSNAGVAIARRSGDKMTEIKPEVHVRYNKEGESSIFVDKLYDTQKELQKKNPQNSYLIEMEDGRSTLWEIENPRWSQMYDHSQIEDMPVISTGLSLLESFNKIFGERELKTALSPGFYLRSAFYDVGQESLAGGAPWYDLPGLPFHISKAFRTERSKGYKYAKEIQKGTINPEIEGFFKYNAAPFYMTEETGGGYTNPHTKAENVIYERMGVKIAGEEDLGIPATINRGLNKAFDFIGFGKLRKAVETQELQAKLTMYLIGRNIKGMGEARAARFAREIGGTPDPYGGGNEATAINKLFLFGRAHINGMRGLYHMFKDDPKGFTMQYAYRKGLPRALMSSAIMGPLIGALFGDEDEKLYRKFLDKVPSFHKLSKFCVPFGFLDDKGNFRGFNAHSDEVNQEWKASYLALPFSRDLVTADTLMSPVFKTIEDAIETGSISATNIAKSVSASISSAFTGQFAPGILAATRMSQFMSGGNPQDYYRNRGILSKDVEQGGTWLEKTYQYLTWSLNSTAPGIFSFNRDKQSSTEPSTPWDWIGAVPVAGSTLRAFVANTNYGDLEKSNQADDRKMQRDATIRLGMGDVSKQLYNEYRKTDAYVSRMGKDWAQHSSPEQIKRVHLLNTWHSKHYRHGFDGLRTAYDNGDSEAIKRESEKLEAVSTQMMDMLK